MTPACTRNHAPTPTAAHVGLIRPATALSRRSAATAIPPPLGLAYVAGELIDAGHRVSVIDAAIEGATRIARHRRRWYRGRSIDQTAACLDQDVTMAVIACPGPYEWPWVADLIRAIRVRIPGVVIVADGFPAEARLEASLRECPELDLCVPGRADALVRLAAQAADRTMWGTIPGLAFLAAGRLVRTEGRCGEQAVPPPRPAWQLFPVDRYFAEAHPTDRGRSLPVAAAVTSDRGASISVARPPDDVVAEMAFTVDRHDLDHVQLIGPAAPLDRSWVLQMCRAIGERGLGVTWELPAGLPATTVDEDAAAALGRAGCRSVTFTMRGPGRAGAEPDGRPLDAQTLKRAVDAARRHGLTVRTSTPIGYRHDTRSAVVRTTLLAGRQALWRVDAARLSMAGPSSHVSPAPDPRGEPRAPGQVSRGELELWRLAASAAFLTLALVPRLRTLPRTVRARCQPLTSGRVTRRVRDWLATTAREHLPVAGSR